eukprot:TRINITY_DN21936_c0_g1_i1.p1 TRINITY_DN21936_c0_g1~~TRINITY_DN21936_c0_g1_i1.p1  ORF type:complete len:383 (-),score=66.37 TRINITY_DN21936_c0_g1_i1:27-1175(-)
MSDPTSEQPAIIARPRVGSTKKKQRRNKTFQIPSKFPEWNDAAIATEKWPYKQAHEDTEFQALMPAEMKSRCMGWKRAMDLHQSKKLDIVKHPKVNVLPRSSSQAEIVLGSESSEDEEKLSATFALASGINRNTFRIGYDGDTCGKLTAATYQVLAHHRERFDASNFLWHLIWPKGKDGWPTYSIAGKYIVKLFLGGKWRKVIVDDQYPIDAKGESLLVQISDSMELWPMLIQKALIKAAASFPGDSQNDIIYLSLLSGWIPQPFASIPTDWNALSQTWRDDSVAIATTRPAQIELIAGTSEAESDRTQGLLSACAMVQRSEGQMLRIRSTTSEKWKTEFAATEDEFTVDLNEFQNSFQTLTLYHNPRSFAHEQSLELSRTK